MGNMQKEADSQEEPENASVPGCRELGAQVGRAGKLPWSVTRAVGHWGTGSVSTELVSSVVDWEAAAPDHADTPDLRSQSSRGAEPGADFGGQDAASRSFLRHRGMTSAPLLGSLSLSHFSFSFPLFSARLVMVIAGFHTTLSPHFWKSLQKNTTFPLITARKKYSKVWKLSRLCFVISAVPGVLTFPPFSYLKTGLF